MVKAGVIIPFYNGADYLPRLIQSVLAESADFYLQVYIVDNSRPEQRLKHDFSGDTRIIVINAEEGIGYGKACNIGYELCKKNDLDYAVVLNQDGYFAKGSFEQLLSVLTEEPEICAAMSFMAEYEQPAIDSLFHHVYLSGISTLMNDMESGRVKKFYKAELLCGAAFAIKCKSYPYPYLFDELFYMYYEDVDLGRRLQYLSKTFVLVPSSIFHHKHSNTDPEQQKFGQLLNKKISRNKYILKDIRVGISRKMLAWVFLELQNMFKQLLKLQLKGFFIGLLSLMSTIASIPVIVKSRQRDRMVSAAENFYDKKTLSIPDL